MNSVLIAALFVLQPAWAEQGRLCAARVEGPSGSYYRKVQGVPSAQYRGFKGALALPRVSFDPDRQYRTDDPKKVFENGPLDRPMVYTGASSTRGEIDAGLAWDRVYDEKKRPLGFAFRPFWRAPGIVWRTPPVGEPSNVYFQPGENVLLEFERKDEGTFHLRLSGDAGVFETDIAAKLPEELAFKRVNSIDQFQVVDGKRVSTERGKALPTKAKAVSSRWESAALWSVDSVAMPTIMAGRDCLEVAGRDIADYDAVFKVSDLSPVSGGESLDILPPSP